LTLKQKCYHLLTRCIATLKVPDPVLTTVAMYTVYACYVSVAGALVV